VLLFSSWLLRRRGERLLTDFLLGIDDPRSTVLEIESEVTFVFGKAVISDGLERVSGALDGRGVSDPIPAAVIAAIADGAQPQETLKITAVGFLTTSLSRTPATLRERHS